MSPPEGAHTRSHTRRLEYLTEGDEEEWAVEIMSGRKSQTVEQHQTLHHFLNLVQVQLKKKKPRQEQNVEQFWLESRENGHPTNLSEALWQSCYKEVWVEQRIRFFCDSSYRSAIEFWIFIEASSSKAKVSTGWKLTQVFCDFIIWWN